MYDIIRRNPIFCGIEREGLRNIFKEINYRIMEYIKGEVVFNEFDFKPAMGIVLDGTVEVQKLHYSGKNIILNRMYKGDVLGVSALFNDKSYYPSRLICKNDCKILFIFQEDLLSIFNKNPHILRRYLSFISQKIYFLNKRIEVFTYESIYERVIYFLEIEREKQNNRSEIVLKYSKQELAEYLCISRASLYRVFNDLVKEGQIIWQKDKIFFRNQ